MSIQLVPELNKNLRVETAISIVANTVVSGMFAWGIFHGVAVIPLWGAQGIAVDLIPTVFMITLALTIALTLITRARIRKGKLPRPTWGRIDLGLSRLLPDNILLRAFTFAAAMTVILVPLSVLLLVTAGVSEMSFKVFFVFKLIYGAIYAVVVTPPVLLRAFADGAVTQLRVEER